jgi:hypothetical protein
VTFSVFVLHIYRCVVVFARTAAAVPPTEKCVLPTAAAAAAAEAHVIVLVGVTSLECTPGGVHALSGFV